MLRAFEVLFGRIILCSAALLAGQEAARSHHEAETKNGEPENPTVGHYLHIRSGKVEKGMGIPEGTLVLIEGPSIPLKEGFEKADSKLIVTGPALMAIGKYPVEGGKLRRFNFLLVAKQPGRCSVYPLMTGPGIEVRDAEIQYEFEVEAPKPKP